MEPVRAYICLKKKKRESNNSNNNNNKTRQAAKAKIFCEALESVPVLVNTHPPCLALLFWQAGKSLQVPVSEGGLFAYSKT